MSSSGHLFTTVIHNKSYPAISTSRPELSQAGRTVLVGGGSTGIGFSIAKSFAAAGASRVIIVGRRQSALGSAVAQVLTEYPGTEVLAYVCDVADEASTEKLWSSLRKDGILVDILVLNAAKLSPEHTILSLGTKKVWEEFVVNVKAPLDMTERFYKQEGRDSSRKLSLLLLSSGAAHDYAAAAPWPNYMATKNSATMLIQQIARNTKPTDMQVVSYHPGVHHTELVKGAAGDTGADTELPWDFDDIRLPGDFAVWAASDEAAFLHGRFVWALWDVDELKAGPIRERIEQDDNFLRVGIHGL
ncbi:putative short-chain dehydrogenase [Ilyonectria robusta]|uniref:putative short-chain dehydrogenase n=1 Tax=Ilyonectria robusta TaxID=1079257 RepID=UPI001E8CD15E|nr:putative short-chain dehydrogenase [Ilyonectria robusta]KAH8672469.1 putative short-chain dehydrogenase [Ilyonectria robusta]